VIGLAAYFDAIAQLAGICPDCGAIFRASDARPFVPAQHKRTVIDRLDAQERRIADALADLDALEQELRSQARARGFSRAQKRLRKIDRAFAASKVDPHDVKVLGHPIEYVAFDGMTKGQLRSVRFCAGSPAVKAQEHVLTSIEATLASGNVEFGIVRVKADGRCHLEPQV